MQPQGPSHACHGAPAAVDPQSEATVEWHVLPDWMRGRKGGLARGGVVVSQPQCEGNNEQWELNAGIRRGRLIGGLQIAELVYRSNLNVTVLLCPQAHTGMLCVEYLHEWRVSARVSQHDRLPAQVSERGAASGKLSLKSLQVQSHHHRHTFHPLKHVCEYEYVCVYLLSKVHSLDFTIGHNLSLTQTFAKIIAILGNGSKFQAQRLSGIIHQAGHEKMDEQVAKCGGPSRR